MNKVLYNENPQILGITVQNLVSQVTSHPRFMVPIVTICILWSSCTDSEWLCKWWLCSETVGVWSQAQTYHKWLQSLSSLITLYKCHFYYPWRQVTLKCSVNMIRGFEPFWLCNLLFQNIRMYISLTSHKRSQPAVWVHLIMLNKRSVAGTIIYFDCEWTYVFGHDFTKCSLLLFLQFCNLCKISLQPAGWQLLYYYIVIIKWH